MVYWNKNKTEDDHRVIGSHPPKSIQLDISRKEACETQVDRRNDQKDVPRIHFSLVYMLKCESTFKEFRTPRTTSAENPNSLTQNSTSKPNFRTKRKGMQMHAK